MVFDALVPLYLQFLRLFLILLINRLLLDRVWFLYLASAERSFNVNRSLCDILGSLFCKFPSFSEFKQAADGHRYIGYTLYYKKKKKNSNENNPNSMFYHLQPCTVL